MEIENIIKTQKMPDHARTVINVIYTAHEIENRITDAVKPYDISIPQFNVLRILKGRKGQPANLCTIQERMIARMSNTTRIIDRLIDKGLVRRKQCPQNRRKVEIFITPEGLELLDRASTAVTAVEKEITDRLTPREIEDLNTALTRLRSQKP
ncbi:MarR family winged helix-turn-helix transcriptional regulator [Sinomicrobium soli]|uniref:MarR family winged helix-turn-helix transcriptional regulator n=1 Tax=Sinomicrobium sp. N-1-3-6 TaxID=2219864 RepID=UPI000DCD27CB|nr:MarR family transcriptional regulator [Sinomicrobium sp. N-1-3-6]RAV29832.1 MarR family transcriptional regulator [Sinomicrobium sp. N-1-3-6]